MGDRVKVSAEGGWRKDFLGVIGSEPKPEQTLQGLDLIYLVSFDTPQHDLSEDGPYVAAEILSCYLTRLPR